MTPTDPVPALAMRIRRMNNLIAEAESPSSPKFSTLLIPCLCLIGFGIFTSFFGSGPLQLIGQLCGGLGFSILQTGLVVIVYLRLQRRINSLVEVVRNQEDRLSTRESQ